MKLSLVLAAGLALAGTAAAQQPAKPITVPLDRIVAVVGDQPITESDMQARIIQHQQENQALVIPKDSAGLRAFELSIINELIDEQVLVNKASDLKIDVPDAQITKTVDDQVKFIRSRFASDAEFRNELKKAGLGTPEEYKRYLTDQARRVQLQQQVIQKMRDQGKLVPINVSEQDVQDAFDRAKGNLPRKPAMITFKQVVINTQASAKAKEIARAKAESLLAEIKKGGDFERIAKRESMDPGSKETGGDLGWNRRGTMVPEFERWMFALAPGQLSPVVETPFGYHIIRVDRINGPEVKVRHILIRPVIDSTDIARTQALADSVRQKWLAGVPFDTLAKKYHDYANREATSIPEAYPRDSLPLSYQDAIRGHKVGDIVVFSIAGQEPGVPKFVVLRIETLEEGGAYTLADLKQRMRAQLVDEGSIRRYIDGLRKQTYVSIRLDAPVPLGPVAGS
jgi:peptidyl-prolyl cis-trans isomerase SurA